MAGNGKTQDGIWLVPDLDGLRSLPCSELDDGTPCWVIAERRRFNLLKNDGRADDNINVIAPLPGSPSAGNATARWIRDDKGVPLPGARDVGDLLAATAPGVVGFVPGFNPFDAFVVYDEFFSLSVPWTSSTAGAGSTSASTTTVTSQTHQGIVALITGAASGGAAVRLSSGSIAVLPNDFSFQYMVNLPVLSTAGDPYKVKMGFTNQSSPANANPTNGLWIEYDQATSPNWLLRAVSVLGGGVVATVDTLIPVAPGWHLLELRRTASGDPLAVIDGVVSSVSMPQANIPRPTEFLSPFMGALKTGGTVVVTIYVDYINIVMPYPAGR